MDEDRKIPEELVESLAQSVSAMLVAEYNARHGTQRTAVEKPTTVAEQALQEPAVKKNLKATKSRG